MTIKDHSQLSTIRTITKLNFIEKVDEAILTAPNPQYIKKENRLDVLLRNWKRLPKLFITVRVWHCFWLNICSGAFAKRWKKIEKSLIEIQSYFFPVDVCQNKILQSNMFCYAFYRPNIIAISWGCYHCYLIIWFLLSINKLFFKWII